MTTVNINQATRLEAHIESGEFAVLGLAQRIAALFSKRSGYQRLTAMDDYLLKDIGLSRSQASGALNGRAMRSRAH